MSVDDPSAKDSIVLGADLVAALGFEPVVDDDEVGVVDDDDVSVVDGSTNGQVSIPETSELEADDVVRGDDDPSQGADLDAREDDTMTNDTATEDDITVDDPVVDESVADESVADESVADEAAFEVAESGSTGGSAIDDPTSGELVVTQSDDVSVVDEIPPPPVGRGRFGVRGLFSRLAESSVDDGIEDRSVPADLGGGSTADLFAAERVRSGESALEPSGVEEFAGETGVEELGGDPSVGGTAGDIGIEVDDDAPPPPPSPRDRDDIGVVPDEPVGSPVDEVPDSNDAEPVFASSYDTHTIDLDADERYARTTTNDVVIGEPPSSGPALGAATAHAGTATGISTALRRSTKLRARKSRRVIRHIDPWSVLTFSIIFHLVFFASLLLAGVLVWNAAVAAGTIENIENFIRELADYETFQINSDQVFKAAVVIAGMLTLASSVLVVLLTVVFNLISDLIGGIRVTVIEEETVRVPSGDRR